MVATLTAFLSPFSEGFRVVYFVFPLSFQDIVVSGVFVLAYLIGGISLAVNASNWREKNDDFDDPPSRFERIANSLGAASVSMLWSA